MTHCGEPVLFLEALITTDGVYILVSDSLSFAPPDVYNRQVYLVKTDVDGVSEDLVQPVSRRGDANVDGRFDLTDAVFTLRGLFAGAQSPPAPFPGCGTDITPDPLSCRLFDACP